VLPYGGRHREDDLDFLAVGGFSFVYLRRRKAYGQAMDSAPLPHDGQLLAAFAHKGDAAAFEAVVRRHEKLVWSVCYSVLRQAQDAEDATQAVFLTLATEAVSLAACASVGPWLHRVGHNVAVNAARLRAARKVRDRKAADMWIGEKAMPDATELKPLVHAAIEKLPEKERRALILFHFEGRSVAETAGALGSSVSTVEKWLARGRERLRKGMPRHGRAPSCP
jgi:RNA polymerase sigma factor (sigma-70 family)